MANTKGLGKGLSALLGDCLLYTSSGQAEFCAVLPRIFRTADEPVHPGGAGAEALLRRKGVQRGHPPERAPQRSAQPRQAHRRLRPDMPGRGSVRGAGGGISAEKQLLKGDAAWQIQKVWARD